MRAWLAFFLVLLLFVEVGAVLFALLFWKAPDEKTVAAVKDVLTIVLGPTVALVGAATGFYYGKGGS